MQPRSSDLHVFIFLSLWAVCQRIMLFPPWLSGLLTESHDNVSNFALQTLNDYPSLSRAVVLSVLLLAVWRIFRFTVSPAFAADDEPRELPYVIPCEPRISIVKFDHSY